jgi:TonB family protein
MSRIVAHAPELIYSLLRLARIFSETTMFYLRICLLVVCGTVFTVANAQQHDDHDHLIEQPMPEFPIGELVRGREGWVLVTYTVQQDGTVFSPIVEESSGSEAFDKAAVTAVSEWRYIPGTEQRESALVNFVFERSQPFVSKKFYFRNEQVHKAINKGDFDDAQNRIDKMRRKDDLTASELAYSYITEGRIYAEEGDKAGQLQCFRKAMINDGRWLDREDYLKLLRASVVLELQLEDYSSALRDHALLSETGVGRKLAADLEEPIRVLESMVASDRVELNQPYAPAEIEVFIQHEGLRRPNTTEQMPSPGGEYETEQRETPARTEPQQSQGG